MRLTGSRLGVLLGLLVGVALGGILLTLRWGMDLEDIWARGSRPIRVLDRSPGTQDPARPASTSGLLDPDPYLADEEDLYRQRSNAIVRATRQVAPAVVSINVVQQQAVRDPGMDLMERLGFIPGRQYYRSIRNIGSGVIVSADGLVVTNYHVIADAVQVIVTLSDGSQYQARLVDTVERYDLAIVQIQGHDLPHARLAANDDLQIGEWAIAIGSPFGYLLADTQPTVTVGVISAVNRDIRRSEGDRDYLGMIQTDAAINPGNSGGPLVNTAGEVVGINTFIFSGTGGSVGIGFAVPVARVRTVIEEVRQYGHYREFYLGFTLHKLSPGLVQSLGLDDPLGFVVTRVWNGSAAWKAGIRPEDILREINGQPLDSADTITRLVYEANVGDQLPFKAERGGRVWYGEIVIEEAR